MTQAHNTPLANDTTVAHNTCIFGSEDFYEVCKKQSELCLPLHLSLAFKQGIYSSFSKLYYT